MGAICSMFIIGTDNEVPNKKDSFSIFISLPPFIPFFLLS